MNSETKLIKSRVGLLNLAEQLNNVTRAKFKIKTYFFRYKLRFFRHACHWYIINSGILHDYIAHHKYDGIDFFKNRLIFL